MSPGTLGHGKRGKVAKSRGRPFKVGNPGGPGRPRGKSIKTTLREAVRQALDPSDVTAAVRALLATARKGSVQACHEVLTLALGPSGRLELADEPVGGEQHGIVFDVDTPTGRKTLAVLLRDESGPKDMLEVRGQVDGLLRDCGMPDGLATRPPSEPPAPAADNAGDKPEES